ncbi:dnaJ homolog subfamily C member 11 [Cimex lectularius]|uniref:J domain-containing protein n=1 Tax=Cimex lectularius TaxID=79782 RepID=A0A8I6RV10_CIMLE|nr:dnaJ homolog subfamily C member 11 [Cimex lectularius]
MDEENEDNSSLFEEDYYAFLNVPRDASTEEVTNAYRRLSRLYHPDKHIDPVQKKDAEVLFNKTKKAYEVLRDAHKRAIYDSVGVKGLETEGLEVMQRTKTPGEIREEYERLARQREERRLQQRTNPKGSVVVNINAMELFSRYETDLEYDLDDGFPTIEVSGMSVTQSIEAPLTAKDTATIAGHLNTHNGTGSGNLTITNKRQLSEKGWVELCVGAGSGPVLGLKGFRTLGKRAFCQADTFLQFGNNGVRTGLDTTVAMQLEKSIMGYLTWRTGSTSSMSTSIIRNTDNSNTNITVLLGIPHSYISLGFTWNFKTPEVKLKSSVKAGTFGAVLEYGAERKVSEQSSVSASVSLGTPTGVVLRLRFTRASQSYLFPIQLCDEVLPSPVFYATVTPLLTWIIVKKLIIDPIVCEQTETKLQKQKDTYKNRMAEKRREAQAATNLMSVTFARIRAEEEARKGLVIVSAEYGRITAPTSGVSSTDGRSEEIIDVTVQLQCLVKDSKLVIHNSTKSQLPGFYDPCVGEDKCLCVQYLFHNHLHQTTISDNEALRIPRQSHRVNPT